jgi:hypothetical protein
MTFEEQFPSLEGKDITLEKLNTLPNLPHIASGELLSQTHFLVREVVVKMCLDKQRVREAIEKICHYEGECGHGTDLLKELGL